MRDYHPPGRSPVYATHGMVATSMPAATLTALDVLRAGGNALDAAVAACAVLCVIEPQSTGIGGDCFCLYAPAGTGKVIALNGSGRAPEAATIDWMKRRDRRDREHLGPRRHRAGRSERLGNAAEGAWPQGPGGTAPAGDPLRGGRLAGVPKVAWDWKRLEGKLRKNAATHFLPGGLAPQPGDMFTQPALAETLRAVARHGAKAFYEGPDRRRHGEDAAREGRPAYRGGFPAAGLNVAGLFLSIRSP